MPLVHLMGRTLHVEKQPNGEWTAIDNENYDGEGSPQGWGKTEDAAIEDLFCIMAEKSTDDDWNDWTAENNADHYRDLRKHGDL